MEQTTYNGRRYTLKANGYWSAPRGSGLPDLHVQVWIDHNGRPVPPGHLIHHVDHDASNNDPSNLVAVTPREHARLHDLQGPGPEVLARAREAAKAWHSTEEGLAFHRRIGGMATPPRGEVRCMWCGKTFEACFPARTPDRRCCGADECRRARQREADRKRLPGGSAVAR